MPFYLKDKDISSEIATLHSVLIVPCRFCPAASLAVRARKPYLAPFRHFLRTPAYESYLRELKSRLEREGIRTRVFDSRWPHQFVVCMWTSRRREALARQARGYDALIVLGCDAAAQTVRDCTGSNDGRVIPAMEVEGLMNVTPVLQFPGHLCLEVCSMTRVFPPSVGAFLPQSQKEMT